MSLGRGQVQTAFARTAIGYSVVSLEEVLENTPSGPVGQRLAELLNQ